MFSFHFFGFYIVTSEPRLLFGSRTNVFLFAKAETAVETRHHCAVFLETRKRTARLRQGYGEQAWMAGMKPWRMRALRGEKSSQDSLCGQQIRHAGFGI